MRIKGKLYLTAAIILIFASIFGRHELADASISSEALPLCFKASKAEIEESALSGWASIDRSFMSEQELSSRLAKVIKGFGFDESNTKKIIETGKDMNKATLCSTQGSGDYTIVIESMRNDDKSEETYCTFRANYKGTYDNIMKDKVNAEKVLKDAKLPIKLDMLIWGSYKRKITKRQGETLVERLLNNILAHKVESIENQTLISVSAFSSRIADYVNSKGEKINVQIAMRYSEYDDKTHLWLGSPVISFEY